jgi:hypothetical protein
MDDDEMYDEFGNYVGPEIGAHSDDSGSSDEHDER